MVERATVAQVAQVGLELTPGVAVPANRRLQALSIEPQIQADVNEFIAAGYKFPSVITPGREWTQAALSGAATYTELIYPLASALTAPVTTQPDATGAPTVYQHRFIPASTAADSPRTFTVEMGSAARAHRFSYGLISALNLDISRQAVNLGGTMLGRRVSDGITLTPNPTTIPLVPILPGQFSLYIDPTAAGLGTTKLTRGFSANWQLGDRFNPIWPLDAALESFAAHVESLPSSTLTLRVAADATGMAYLTDFREGDTLFTRVEAVGAIIQSTHAYRFTLDYAGIINAAPQWQDLDGLYVIQYQLRAVHNDTWGQSMRLTVVNNLATL